MGPVVFQGGVALGLLAYTVSMDGADQYAVLKI
jgi:hypothetical protein